MYLIPLRYGLSTIFLIFQRKENEECANNGVAFRPITVREKELL